MKKTLAQPVNELDLFYETTLTYEKIKQVAREEKIEIEKTIPLMEQPRFHSPALAHLEMHYEARPNEKVSR